MDQAADNQTASPARSRAGGRAARKALRAAPLAEDIKPVRPGMESGNYQLLKPQDMERIHNAALDVLEQVGMADAIPSCIEACTAIGAIHGADGRLRFPRALVEDIVAKANRTFTLCGRDEKHDIKPHGSRTHFGTAGAAVHIVDGETGDYRESYLQDLYDIGRIVDEMEHIHFFQRSVVARDIPDPYELDLNTLYASLKSTNKHVGTSMVTGENTKACLEMCYELAGGEDKFRARPFVSQSNCFVVPPLKFAEDACDCLEVAVRGGMPVLLLSAGQAGATSPASLAGSAVQEVAEVLAGLVYVNAIVPGAPAIFGTWPFVSDLRSGAMCGGSGEQALLSSACAQMGRFYDLPVGVAGGMADSKIPDIQAGYEKGYSHALIGNSGVNMVYESAGMHASLLGFCLESLIIDNDGLGAAQRTIKGLDLSDAALSVDVIKQVCTEGPGHYLGSDQTLERMQRDYIYPEVGDRSSPKEWFENERPTALSNALKRKDQILRQPDKGYIPADIEASWKAKYPLRDVKAG